MPFVEVVFELPTEIAEGLISGRLEQVGGVIRDKATKQVFCWLREAGPLKEAIEKGTELSPQVADQLGKLHALAGVQVGLQALTLGATVAGFALLYKRTVDIERKIDALAREVTGQFRWLHILHDQERSARLSADLESAAWSERNGLIGEMPTFRREFTRAEKTYEALMEAMLLEKRAYEEQEVFQSFFQGAAFAGLAKARTDWLLLDAAAAEATLTESRRQLNAVRQNFMAPFKSFDMSRLQGAPAGQIANARQTALKMTACMDSMTSHLTELAWCRSNSVSRADWERLGFEEKSAAVAFLVPPH